MSEIPIDRKETIELKDNYLVKPNITILNKNNTVDCPNKNIKKISNYTKRTYSLYNPINTLNVSNEEIDNEIKIRFLDDFFNESKNEFKNDEENSEYIKMKNYFKSINSPIICAESDFKLDINLNSNIGEIEKNSSSNVVADEKNALNSQVKRPKTINSLGTYKMNTRMLHNDSSNSSCQTIFRILIVDNDINYRKSSFEIISKYFKKRLNYKLDYIEASDGIECLSEVYKNTLENKKINCIVMDENMRFLNGSKCSKILYKLSKKNCFQKIPIFVLTSNELTSIRIKFNQNIVDKIFSKPLIYEIMDEIFNLSNYDINDLF